MHISLSKASPLTACLYGRDFCIQRSRTDEEPKKAQRPVTMKPKRGHNQYTIVGTTNTYIYPQAQRWPLSPPPPTPSSYPFPYPFLLSLPPTQSSYPFLLPHPTRHTDAHDSRGIYSLKKAVKPELRCRDSRQISVSVVACAWRPRTPLEGVWWCLGCGGGGGRGRRGRGEVKGSDLINGDCGFVFVSPCFEAPPPSLPSPLHPLPLSRGR